MGNLQNKYTDEEWERLVEGFDKKNQHLLKTFEYPLTPDECFKTNSPITNLVKALKEDRDYYESWKANIAMAFKDEYTRQSYKVDDDRLNGFLTEIDIHGLANNAADNFLRQLIS